jgi:hypothetical protein
MACAAPLPARVVDVRGRQVLYMLPGDVELDTVLADVSHGADRDRHDLAAEHVSLLEEHVGALGWMRWPAEPAVETQNAATPMASWSTTSSPSPARCSTVAPKAAW